MARYILTFDVGGTITKGATFKDDSIVYQSSFFTPSGGKTPYELIQRLVAQINEHRDQLEGGELAGIGIIVPGPTDGETVFQLPNVKGWEEPVALKQELWRILSLPVFLENDANGAALGENRFGAGKGSTEMVYITVSTGIGGGRITRGLLDRGSNGSAVEVGHMKIDAMNGPKCGCGGTGCLEAFASGTAIARAGRTLMIDGDFANYLTGRNLTQRDVTAVVVAEAARSGEPGHNEPDDPPVVISARHAIDRAAIALGMGLASLANLFAPELFVLGGGVMKSADLILPTAERILRQEALGANAHVRLVRAQLGDQAGLFGALALVQQELLED